MRKIVNTHPIVKPIAACVFVVILSACDGDARPLIEAVEANETDLASIVIQPPANSIEPLHLGLGTPVQFSILGTTLNGSLVSVSASDRRWVSSNESVATVSENGVVVGRRNGFASIGVRVAGAVAVDFPLEVSDATVQSIDSIVGNNGNTELSSCLPENFTAIGNFGGDDLRALSDVEWAVNSASQAVGAEVFEGSSTPSGGISLVGRLPTGNGVPNVTLTATLPADQDTEQPQLSLSRSFGVRDTLTNLELTPDNVAIEEGSRVQLFATANFSDQQGSVSVTDGVDWTVELSPSVASVSTVGDNPGLVTGLTMGQARITAVCGNISASTNITVEDTSNSLSFNRSGTLSLDLVNDRIFDELRVSTGDEYNADRDETNDADWSSSDTTVVTVDSDDLGNDRGTLTLVGEGSATITAEFNDIQIEIDIEVTLENDFSLGL